MEIRMSSVTSTNAPTVFNFNETSKVRVVTIEGEPWFVAADVCKVLALSAKYACDRLAESEKSYVARTDLGLPAGRQMYIISESGLYKLIMRSGKTGARKSRMACAVLPQLALVAYSQQSHNALGFHISARRRCTT